MRIFAVLCAWLLSFGVLAGEKEECNVPTPELISDLQGRLVQHAQWSTDFAQLNHLKALRIPLQSQGTLYVSQNSGLVWQVNTPVSSRVVLTDDGVNLGTGVVSASQMTASLLRSVLIGQFDQLNAQFTLSGCADESGWQIQLLPKETFLQQRIQSIEIQGESSIDRLVVLQSGGNKLEVTFDQPMPVNALPIDIDEALSQP